MNKENQIKYLTEITKREEIMLRLSLEQTIALDTVIYRLQSQLDAEIREDKENN